ncbi:Dot/Icm T4SS effector AnkC/LegA12 [Legionella sp. km772]|uniref:Dot/Icm T4SS effector AnkC/LegA12 n=1 Tax=Legionella sp. km772 TaxID=2498111 RepID=UPI000F8D933D|nr:Dot/Icm T4SS effector AnkC/LegA12 [Legionella sp. km772]RUR06584.1 ankyrin repeat domain-containing protein [Legionella sp. km772]
MDSIFELDNAIHQGLTEFKAYVQEQLKKQPDFLEHSFCLTDASQMTVLNYLIHLYQEPAAQELADNLESTPNPLRPMIDHVLALMDDKNIGTALHQAVSEGKIELALYLLSLVPKELEAISLPPDTKPIKKNKRALSVFNVDQRDQEGRTLLSLILASKNDNLLVELLKRKPNVHVPTNIGELRIPFQPLHQAVVLNYPQAIRLLAKENVQLANPCGLAQDTPVLLAAHLSKIDALEALLEQPIEQLSLEAKRTISAGEKTTQHTAMDRLCEHLYEGKNKEELIRGIAMLLCRGAEPPQSETMRQLLNNNRSALLKAIHVYLEDKPDLVDPFVRRCHQRESALHNIVYAHHSWGNAIRHLFGQPSDVAWVVENLVVRKYTTTSNEKEVLPTSVAANLSSEKDPVKLYAMFVKRYTDGYNNQFFKNSWSKMRWMIADGQCDWETVQQYVKTNPNTRSAQIYNDMFKSLAKVNDAIPEVELTVTNSPSM